jgi:hypothetical protein
MERGKKLRLLARRAFVVDELDQQVTVRFAQIDGGPLGGCVPSDVGQTLAHDVE